MYVSCTFVVCWNSLQQFEMHFIHLLGVSCPFIIIPWHTWQNHNTINLVTRTQFRIVSYPIREPSLFHISHIHIFSTFCLKIGYPHFFHGISPFSLFKWIHCAYLDQSVDTSSLRHTQTHPNIVHLHIISILYYSSMISIYQ